jgi:predicted SnoaL-like aldol condensation-catalyzing enzyme
VNDDLEANKRTVVSFYELAFNSRQPAEAIARYAGPGYRQHNPEVGDGPEAFIGFVAGFTRAFPQLHLHIQRVIAEGPYVVLHVWAKTTPSDRGKAVVDIFRLQDGRVVEHWDVLQDIPERSANQNTMF